MSDKLIQAWELVDRLDYIEEQLRTLWPDQYVSFSEVTAKELPPEVVELARSGKTLAATQAYMKHAGVSIMEAKRVIDSL
jgi:Mor family transcriptional regulator